MTPEGAVKRKVSAILKSYGTAVYYHMPVVTGFGRPSLDYIGCVSGKFFSVETKKPGGKPTERQHITMREMREAGAIVFVISDDAGLAAFKFFLDAHT